MLNCFGATWLAMIVAMAIEMEPAFKEVALVDEDLKGIWYELSSCGVWLLTDRT
jgi:hypothetical protein